MATTTLTLACIGSAYADYANQSTNYSTEQEYDLQYVSTVGGESRLYLKFEAFPRAYFRRALEDAYVTEYWRATYSTSLIVSANFHACGDFDESTLTYANAPEQTAGLGYNSFQSITGHVTPNPTVFPENVSSGSSAPKNAKAMLQRSCVYINRQAKSGYSSTHLYLKTRRASEPPVLTVKFGSSVVVYKCKGTSKTSGYVDRFTDNKFTWSIVKSVSGDYCVADPVQVSAVFHWRQGNSGSFNEIEISGNQQELTVPAGTFPGGSIQWFVTAKDDYNIDLREDNVYTISTLVGDLKAAPASPINGAFCDPLGGTTFSWTLSNDHLVTIQTGADIEWSPDQTTWYSLGHVDGGDQSFTSPAGVFGAGTYYWRVRAYNADGDVGPWSDPATLSTIDSTMYAVPRHPVSEIVETNAEAVFAWGYNSDTGTTPTRTDLQYSRNGAEWTDLATVGSGVLTYTTPAGFFLAGTVYWRARVYNHNDVAGPWCDSVSFISFGAPEMPSVSVDAVPFATLRWQVAGQDAYRIEIDGKNYGPYFGSQKNWTVPEPLEDGRHAAKVYIQGAYSLWSQPGEIVFEISNIPGQPVNLSGRMGRDAELRWTCEDATADFLIYRDDVQIGHSSGYSFTDRTVLDFHTWRVINRLPGGYYTASNTVSGTLCTEGLALALLAGGPWLDLTLSTNAIRTTTAAAGRSVVLRQFAGREYPDAEAAPYKTLQISFDVSWTPAQADEARAFEALIGEAVIFKEPGEEAFVGVLSAFQRSRSCPARSYTATVQRIHWREYVDADS